MRKWEDIVKDKVEEPEGALPESVFAEFRARRNSPPSPTPKRFPLVWVLASAVAAGLAAVLLLRQPTAPVEGIQVVRQPSAPVAIAVDSTEASEPMLSAPLIAQMIPPKTVRKASSRPQRVIVSESDNPADETISPQTTESTATEQVEETVVDNPFTPASSPFIPEKKTARSVGVKIIPAAGVIAGGGLLAAVAAPLLGAGSMEDAAPTMQGDPYHGGVAMDPGGPKDKRTGDAIHCFPLKLGLSARIPISERLSVTTGLDYSWYRSSFTYSLSGEKVQNAHFLGLPVRLDWMLASNKWLEVYAGGGLEGDYCLRATLAGDRIAKDGFSASVLGAGGIQFKPTKRLGFYLEPQLSWTLTPKDPVLETYRTENTLMFSVAAGLRFTIGK